MPDAIVFESNTGFTKRYAELIAGYTGLPCYALKESERSLKKGAKVIFLGWLRAGKIVGLKKAQSRFSLAAVLGVGIRAQTPESLSDLKAQNKLSSLPAFYLRGGMDVQRMSFMSRLMIKTAAAVMSRKAPKDDPEAMESFDMLKSAKDFVSRENLSDFLDWYKGSKR